MRARMQAGSQACRHGRAGNVVVAHAQHGRRSLTVRCRAGSAVATKQALTVAFQLPYRVQFGQMLGLVGSSELLGAWEEGKALRMTWSQGDWWLAEIQVEPDQAPEQIEYKYVVLGKDGVVQHWKPGGNYHLHIRAALAAGGKRLAVTDTWDGGPRVLELNGQEWDQDTAAENLPADNSRDHLQQQAHNAVMNLQGPGSQGQSGHGAGAPTSMYPGIGAPPPGLPGTGRGSPPPRGPPAYAPQHSASPIHSNNAPPGAPNVRPAPAAPAPIPIPPHTPAPAPAPAPTARGSPAPAPAPTPTPASFAPARSPSPPHIPSAPTVTSKRAADGSELDSSYRGVKSSSLSGSSSSASTSAKQKEYKVLNAPYTAFESKAEKAVASAEGGNAVYFAFQDTGKGSMNSIKCLWAGARAEAWVPHKVRSSVQELLADLTSHDANRRQAATAKLTGGAGAAEGRNQPSPAVLVAELYKLVQVGVMAEEDWQQYCEWYAQLLMPEDGDVARHEILSVQQQQFDMGGPSHISSNGNGNGSRGYYNANGSRSSKQVDSSAGGSARYFGDFIETENASNSHGSYQQEPMAAGTWDMDVTDKYDMDDEDEASIGLATVTRLMQDHDLVVYIARKIALGYSSKQIRECLKWAFSLWLPPHEMRSICQLVQSVCCLPDADAGKPLTIEDLESLLPEASHSAIRLQALEDFVDRYYHSTEAVLLTARIQAQRRSLPRLRPHQRLRKHFWEAEQPRAFSGSSVPISTGGGRVSSWGTNQVLSYRYS